MSVELEATIKVLAVEANAHASTKLQLNIKKFIRDGDPLVPAGTVIVLENRGDSVSCTIDGEAIDPDVREAVDLLVSVHSPRKHESLDDVMEPDQPKKVGDTWQPDPAHLARYWATAEYPLDKDDVKCTVKLAGVDNGPHGPVLHIDLTTELKMHQTDWHNNYRINDSLTKTASSETLPEDPSDCHSEFHDGSTFTAKMSYKTPDGKTMDYDFTAERSVSGTVTPVDSK